MTSRTETAPHNAVGRDCDPFGPLGANRRRGMTLIELLLVIIIIGFVTAIAMPQMVKSIRGNRLRTASQSVISAGRYARSMAILRQADTLLTFHLGQGKIEVHEPSATPAATQEEPADAGSNSAAFVATTNATGAAGAGDARLNRKLDRVTIESVSMGGSDSYSEGSCTIKYRRNGLCAPYTVKLVDEYGAEVVIEVDQFSSPKVKSGAQW